MSSLVENNPLAAMQRVVDVVDEIIQSGDLNGKKVRTTEDGRICVVDVPIQPKSMHFVPQKQWGHRCPYCNSRVNVNAKRGWPVQLARWQKIREIHC